MLLKNLFHLYDIFKKKNGLYVLNGAPPGTKELASPLGWVNANLFLQWLMYFQAHEQSFIGSNVLLLLDNYASHL